MTVAQILNAKGRAVVTAAPGDTVLVVARVLSEKKIGAVVVVDAQGRIGGIVSERDIVRAVAAGGAEALNKSVKEFMTSTVKTCAPRDTEAELMSLMTEHRVRHLPVVEGGKLGGMISIGDVVKHRIEAIEREAEEMKSYIASSG
ncbi:CBS domain-containing protein [Nordella sp. HKS 07]|uniref:CBS domain-containing protein n=1 Tax=Nordella sp. HKS 07 TaxID=2712222 RepID=UPI0019D1A942|nr:CBS domain-containing protein [Nordella sp. HKS 07]